MTQYCLILYCTEKILLMHIYSYSCSYSLVWKNVIAVFNTNYYYSNLVLSDFFFPKIKKSSWREKTSLQASKYYGKNDTDSRTRAHTYIHTKKKRKDFEDVFDHIRNLGTDKQSQKLTTLNKGGVIL